MDVGHGLDASHDFVERTAGGIFDRPLDLGQTIRDASGHDFNSHGIGSDRIRHSSFSVDQKA